MPDKKLKRYWNRYVNILHEGSNSECPRNHGSGDKKGRVKQTTARNLLERLRKFDKCVLAFMYDPEIPFDNNQAECDIRMMKVQQKISGCFRTTGGIERFCRIRGYISTAKKQGVNVLNALQHAMQGQAILFNSWPFWLNSHFSSKSIKRVCNDPTDEYRSKLRIIMRQHEFTPCSRLIPFRISISKGTHF